MSTGEILWLVLMAGILLWGFDYIKNYGKKPAEPKPETNGSWRDCRHEWGLLEHFVAPWFFTNTICCAQSGRFRCQLGSFHKGQHWGTLPEDD